MTTHVKSVTTFPGLAFGPEQTATFAPIADIIAEFGERSGLQVSRTFDRDPLSPRAAYFINGWPGKKAIAFLRIHAVQPFAVGTEFVVSAIKGLHRHKTWPYSSTEGTERLLALLNEAKQFIEEEGAI